MRKGKYALLPALLLALLLNAACAAETRLRDVESVLYENEAGYHITVPAAWQLLQEDEATTRYAAADQTLALTMVNELGGEAYYPLAEIVEMLAQQLLRQTAAQELGLDLSALTEDESQAVEARLTQLQTAGQGWRIEKKIVDDKDELRYLLQLTLSEGAPLLADIYITQPYAGIRYYVLLLAGEEAYEQCSRLYGDMLASFAVDQDRVSLYQLMAERREAAGIGAYAEDTTEDGIPSEDEP